MADKFIVAVKGTKQGQFKGESKTPHGNSKWIEIIDCHLGVATPYDTSSGQASGKRQHAPVVITKEWGPSSPLFMTACATREVLSEILIQKIALSSRGGEVVVERITLTNAQIVESRTHVGKAAGGGRNLTDYSFTFQRITVENLDTSTTATDSWTG